MANIIRANEVLKNQDMTRFNNACKVVMNDIRVASKKGYRSTCFRAHECREQVKEEFKRNGYTFKPTGYVGGVWQMTEDICW